MIPTNSQITAELYKMVIYPPGGFFRPHRDTQRVENMFGTLVVVLTDKSYSSHPSLLLKHEGKMVEFCGRRREEKRREERRGRNEEK
jgi:hypothetical protein